VTERCRVLVVDDSALYRRMLVGALQSDPRVEVVGQAGDVYQARDLIVELRPDVMTLDMEMPGMDGLEFLRRLMPQFPLPVLMLSAHGDKISEAARRAGAVDVLTKPADSAAMRVLLQGLPAKVLAAARGDSPASTLGGSRERSDEVVAIGSSTGGVEALAVVLPRLPADVPGTLVVQHMPPKFTGPMAQRLNTLCPAHVKEAQHGDRIERGLILIAPGDRHMVVVRAPHGFVVHLTDDDKAHGHRPSVSVMMLSVAKVVGAAAAGAVLTGMGRDGSDGLLAMRRAGAYTVAQDEATSVVWGMPRAAAECGAAVRVAPLDDVASVLLEGLQSRRVAS
jgi:two-component system chemotaxis response regulator CheB